MKKLLFVPLFLFCLASLAQVTTPPNYIKLNSRYDFIEGKFAKTLHFPAGSATPTLYGGWNGAGAPYWDSVGKKLRIWDGNYFRLYPDSIYNTVDSSIVVQYGTRKDTLKQKAGGGGGSGTITGTSDNMLKTAAPNINSNKTFAALTFGATTTWNLQTGFDKKLTLTGDANLVFTNAQNGDHCFLLLFQDGTGGHELTVPDQIIQIGTHPNDTTIVQGIYDGTAWWFATSGGSLTNITGLVTAGTAINITGTGTGASPYVVNFASPFTWGSGLTNTSNTITNNLITGLAGGQTVLGGTAASENLTLASTGNATKGNTYIGSSSKFTFDEANTEFRIGSAADQGAYQMQNNGNVITGMGATNSQYDLTNINNTTGTSSFRLLENNLTELGRFRGFDPSVGTTTAGISNNNAVQVVNQVAAGAPLFLTSNAGSVYITTNNTTPVITATQAGKVGINQGTPTAYLHLPAGTASANTAPLKLTSGTNLTTGEAGAMEYDGTNLYFTRTGTTRETVVTDVQAVTLTNKRITVRNDNQTSSSSYTPNADNFDVISFTALAANLTINAPSGTPTPAQMLLFRIVDNGTGRTLTWDSGTNGFAAGATLPLPTGTTAGKWLYVQFMWNGSASPAKWHLISVIEI